VDKVRTAPGWGGALLGIYEQSIRFLAGCMMTAIVVIMITQVTARYVFGSSLIWAEELCRYILIWMTFLLLGMSYRRGEFITLEMLPAVVSVTARRVVRIVMAVPTLVFLAMMVWAGWNYSSRFGNQTIPALDFIWTSLRGEPLQLSIRWVYVSVSVGCGLLFVHILIDAILSFRQILRGEPDQGERIIDSGEIA